MRGIYRRFSLCNTPVDGGNGPRRQQRELAAIVVNDYETDT